MSDVSLKFNNAKFYNPDLGDWQFVTPPEYKENAHKGRLECPAEGCHGALIYVSGEGRSKNASNDPLTTHFKSNHHGEPHQPSCVYMPEREETKLVRLSEALERGDHILFNINFSTSYDREKGRLSKTFAKAALQKLYGEYRPDWVKAHRKQYVPYSETSVEKIFADIKRLKNAAAQIGMPREKVTERLCVSYLHAVVPWTSFYLRHDKNKPPQVLGSNALHTDDVFRLLYQEIDSSRKAKNLWNAAPVFRRDVSLLNPEKSKGNRFFTHVFDHVQIDQKRFPLQDVLIVKDPKLAERVRSAKSLSYVATPYIVLDEMPKDLERGYLHLHYPITSDKQLIIK